MLVTILLFSAGAAALAWVISAGVFASASSEAAKLALDIAQARMEALKDMSYTAIAAEGSTGPAPDPNFPQYDVTRTVAAGADPMRIDVTVGWETRGGRASVTLTTQRTDI